MFNTAQLKLQLLLGSSLSGGAGDPAKAVAGNPVNRQVVTLSVNVSLLATATADTSVDFYVNGAYVLTMTPGAMHTFTGTWTPPASAQVVTANFVGNVSGFGPNLTVIVDAANTFNGTMTAWTQSNTTTTVAGAVTPPISGATVYLVKPSGTSNVRPLFYHSPTSPGTIFHDGLDIWVGIPTGSVTTTFAYASGGTGNIDVLTEETAGANMYTTVVERKVVNGITWKRIQMVRLDSASSNGTTAYFDLARTVEGYQNSTNMQVSAGELTNAGLYFCLPRRVDDIKIPFLINEKAVFYKHSVDTAALGVAGAEQHYFKARNVDSETNMAGGPKGISARYIFPTGYNKTAGTGRLLLILKAQTDAADSTGGNKTTWQTAIDSVDYANTYNVVVCVIDERPSEGYWAGTFDNGTKNMLEFYNEVWFPEMVAHQGISPNAIHTVVGFSKGGNAAGNFRRKYPNIWKNFGAADAAWLNAYPANNAGLSYNSAGTYNANDLYQNIVTDIALFNDKNRMVITGGFAWNTDLAAMKARLDLNSIPYTYYTSAWTSHNWGPTGGINTAWTPAFIAAVMALP